MLSTIKSERVSLTVRAQELNPHGAHVAGLAVVSFPS